LADGALVTNLDFQLSDFPLIDSIEVYVNGTISLDWSYDSATNAIIFTDESVAPLEGDLVTITYGHFGECP